MTRPRPDPQDGPRRPQTAWRRRVIPTAVGLVVFGSLGVVGSDGEVIGVGIGAWMAGLGVLMLAGLALREREAKGVGPRGRLASRTLDGEPATVLHEHPVRHLLGAALAGYATVPFVALLVPSLRPAAGDSARTGAVLLLFVLLIPVVLTVGAQLRRASRAGLWLTPTALVVRERDVTTRVAWANIRSIPDADGPSETLFVTLHDPAAVTIVARRQRDARLRAMLGGVMIGTGALTLDAPSLVGLLRTCAAPGGAERLGSEAGLALVRGSRRSAVHL